MNQLSSWSLSLPYPLKKKKYIYIYRFVSFACLFLFENMLFIPAKSFSCQHIYFENFSEIQVIVFWSKSEQLHSRTTWEMQDQISFQLILNIMMQDQIIFSTLIKYNDFLLIRAIFIMINQILNCPQIIHYMNRMIRTALVKTTERYWPQNIPKRL